MKMILLALLEIGFGLLLLRLIVFCMNKAINKVCGKRNERETFHLSTSLLILFANVLMWLCVVMKLISMEDSMTAIHFYFGFVMIGIFCVTWCYFSCDLEKIFSMPRKATTEEQRLKKIIMYIFLGLFAVLQGYHQTKRMLYVNYEIPLVFSAINSSVIVAIIALDRVANQLFGGKKSNEDKNVLIDKAEKNNIVKKDTSLLISHLKRIWILEKSKYILIFSILVFLSYALLILQEEKLIPAIDLQLEYQFLVWYLLPLIIVLFDYWWNKDVRNGLWVKIMEQCSIKEDYKKFMAIKECIETFEQTDGKEKKCDIIANVNVIEAIIEHNKSQVVIVPIVFTVLLAIFIENNTVTLSPLVLLIFILWMLLLIWELVLQIPKDGFIKKVTSTIRE